MLRGVELGKVKVNEADSGEGMVVDEEKESVEDVAMEERWLVECSDTMKIPGKTVWLLLPKQREFIVYI